MQKKAKKKRYLFSTQNMKTKSNKKKCGALDHKKTRNAFILCIVKHQKVIHLPKNSAKK